jgi:DNA-binding MarR family transcriptional regulator
MHQNPGDPGCTCYRLRKAARIASRIYDKHLAAAGVNIGQFGVLVTIDAMQGASISRLAELLQMDRTTLTRNLTPLERSGYVVVRPGADKRSKAVDLTHAGGATLRTARPLWRDAQNILETTLGMSEKKALHKALERTIALISAVEYEGI